MLDNKQFKASTPARNPQCANYGQGAAKRIILMLLMCLVLPLLFAGCGETATKSNDYTLSNYDVHAYVSKENVVTITEEFTVHFNVQMHGVMRYIPMRTTAYYQVGDKVVKKTYKTEISNARVLTGNCVDRGESGFNYFFQLGDQYSYQPVGSSTTFAISYDMKIPDNRLTEYDTFYYNIIPFDWDVEIHGANFVIEYENDISESVLHDMTHVYVGAAGTTQAGDGLTIAFDNSTISGSVDFLDAFEGVTVYTEFEKGFFGYNQAKYWWIGIGALVLLILVILWAFYYFNKRKINRMLVPTVEFKAPQGLTPAECGLILDGKVDNRDLLSMIVYWASKGYIKIIEKNKQVSLEKLKELDNPKRYEKTIFDAIFEGSDLVEIKKINNFGEAVSNARAQLKVDLKHTNFETKTKTARGVFQTLSAIIPAIATFMLLVFTANVWAIFVAIGECAAIACACGLYNFADDKKHYHSQGKTKFLKLIALFVPLAFCFGLFFVYEFYVDRVVLILWAHLASVLLMIMSAKVLSRTEISVERLGKIVGLKNYIRAAEKDRLEMLVKETPSLFYDVLPYAYVLNVTDEYCKKFEQIKISPPEWYVSDAITGNDFITGMYIATLLNNSVSKVNSVLLSPMNNADSIAKALDNIGGNIGGGIGGGTKGGGFGGGGLGGGGGRGW